jgi:hypothetical protein
MIECVCMGIPSGHRNVPTLLGLTGKAAHIIRGIGWEGLRGDIEDSARNAGSVSKQPISMNGMKFNLQRGNN